MIQRGAWVVGRGSWVVDRGSWVVGRGSWVVGRGAGSEEEFNPWHPAVRLRLWGSVLDGPDFRDKINDLSRGIMNDHLSHLLAIWLVLASPAVAGPPTLEHLFPAGGARGTTFEVTATGKFDRWPVRGWSSRQGVVIEAGAEKGKLVVKVAPDAATGVYWVRLHDEEGATGPRPFVVGSLPEVAEVEPNDAPGQAQRVDRPAVAINGRLGKNGDVDGFVVRLDRGQTLVAALEANRRLGSPMDGVLQVATPDGFVLAQVDDDPDRDPLLVFEAPAAGDYVVRAFAFPFVQESAIRFAGGPSFIYRLTLTTEGYVDHAAPLAVARSGPGPAAVDLVGWNIPDAARRLPVPPVDDRDDDPDRVVRVEHPMLGNAAEVRVGAGLVVTEETAGGGHFPRSLAEPVTFAGRLDPPGDVDTFAFVAAKGTKLVFRVEARGLGRPVDAVLRIADASGVPIAEVDDARGGVSDPEARFTAPGDGTYLASVRDLNGGGGPRMAYLLTAGPPVPDFALTLKGDQFPLKPGQPTEVVVAVDRREGYAEPIEIGPAEPFDGVIAPKVTSGRVGPTAQQVTLKLTPCDCARAGPIRIVGLAPDGRRRVASAPVAGQSATIDSAWLAPSPVK